MQQQSRSTTGSGQAATPRGSLISELSELAPTDNTRIQGAHPEQIRLLYLRAGTALAVQMALLAVAALQLVSVVAQEALVAGLAVTGALALWQGLLGWRFRVAQPATDSLEPWVDRHARSGLLLGAAWGVSPALSLWFPASSPQLGATAPALLALVATFAFAGPVSRAFCSYAVGWSLAALAAVGATLQPDLLPTLGTLAAAALTLVLASRSLTDNFGHFALMGQRNAALMRKIAQAKDQSDANLRKLEEGNQRLAAEIAERERAEARIRESERQLASILENMQDPLYRTDADGRITWISPSIETLLGYEPKDLVGQDIRSIYVDAEERDRFLSELDKRFGTLEHFEIRLRHQADFEVWVSENAHYLYDDDHNLIGVEGSLRDITERKITEEALFQEREKAHVTLESIGDGVISTDVTGAVEYVNPVAEKVTGWDLRDARGESVSRILRLVDENTGLPMDNPVARCLKSGAAVKLSGHPRITHRYGEKRYSVEVIASPIRDSEGEVIGAVLVFHDVTDLRGLAQELSHQAKHDSLTGLINRREFEIQVERMLERCRRESVEHALLYLDLDQFKVVNDTCGHNAGDELLKQLTAKLRGILRRDDVLARLGGDEFGVVLEDCPIEDALRIAENLRKTVEEFRFGWDEKTFRVGVSIGLVPLTRASGNLSDVLSAADSACYVAKDGGRNRVHLYQPDDRAVSERNGQMRWLSRIQSALDNDRFRLYFQPIVHIKGRVPGLHGEVLIRMLSESGDLIAPGAFLPAAERYHLMPQIDRWVVRHTFTTLTRPEIRKRGIATCCINLSGQSLSEPGFLDYIVDEIRRADVSPKILCFEITETAVISNLSNATNFISVLRGMGCRFALDDFGSGLSSFAYLKNLQVDYIKLDGTFVKNMVRDNIDRAMVKAINQVGHVMSIQTIAEFVEDEATMKALGVLGIDFAQGFGIAMPRPIELALGEKGAEERPASKPGEQAAVARLLGGEAGDRS